MVLLGFGEKFRCGFVGVSLSVSETTEGSRCRADLFCGLTVAKPGAGNRRLQVLRAGQALSPRKKDRGIRGNGDRVALDSAVEEGGKVRECEAVRHVLGISLKRRIPVLAS